MRRFAACLIFAATLAACGGSTPAVSAGASASGAPAASTTASAAASTGTSGGAGGTATLTLGALQGTYPITSCTEVSGVLNIMAGDQKTDGVQFVFPADTSTSASLEGHIAGKEWVGTNKGTFTRSGRSGTFTSPTLGIPGTVQGTFSCG